MKTQLLKRSIAIFLMIALVIIPLAIPAFADEDVDYRNNVYKPGQGLRVSLSGSLDNPEKEFKVTGPDGKVEIASVTAESAKIYVITFAEELDLRSEYTLTYEGKDYKVNLPSYYSTEEFEAAYTYSGDDLGATWTKDKTTFRVWAPTATAVSVNLYETGDPANGDLIEQLPMTADVNGTWIAEISGDQNGIYYTYQVEVDGQSNEACDPYARTTGVNGMRAMILDLDSTDPTGWDKDKDPHYGNSITDAIIYELHVRDLSMDDTSGITNKGKFLGVIETGTTNPKGKPTGLDYIKNLGITHIHLLPSYDYATVDETNLEANEFNWGYDPKNYNVPEGSYSTDPYNGEVRVKEFKTMVKGLHDNGISVIMDVVYNHVYDAKSFCFNQIVPDYFSRVTPFGNYSQGSGCGNDTASERSMVKKYIVDSVTYWADEYHIDGFRFDLVGLIDTETMNAVIEEVHKTHPNVIFYGEGWNMSTDLTKDGYELTTQANSELVNNFSFFNDTLRDSIRGPMSQSNKPGYISGGGGFAGDIARCFMGQTTWCQTPTQSINYASCHDNLALYDRIIMSTPGVSNADRAKMNSLAAAIVMTSQGVPFFQAGEELFRSKPLGDGTYDHNSYKSPDSVNSIKWDALDSNSMYSSFEYYQGLIAFRKAHPALRLTTAEEVSKYITKLETSNSNLLAFHIAGEADQGASKGIIVIFNANKQEAVVDLPEGTWNVYVNDKTAGTKSLGSAHDNVTVAGISAMVLSIESDAVEAPEKNYPPVANPRANMKPKVVAVAIAAAVLAVGTVAVLAVRFFKKR
jgi:pullulanase